MLKEFISVTLLAAFLISSGFAATGEQKDVAKIGSEEYILETTAVVELEPFYPRGLSPEKSELKTSEERGKLRGQIELNKEAGKYTEDSVIPIKVVLNYDEDVEEKFEKEFERLFGNTLKFERSNYRKYDLNVKIKQLEILIEMDEVLFITTPTDGEAYILDLEISGEFTPNMNAASEMLGVKKARSDFGVTGDLDGDETRYSKNDVVIAIINSGIDISHVDLE